MSIDKYAQLCITLHNMHDYSSLGITMYDYASIADFTFCQERDQHKKWGAVRTVKCHDRSMRVFQYTKDNGFTDGRHFMSF